MSRPYQPYPGPGWLARKLTLAALGLLILWPISCLFTGDRARKKPGPSRSSVKGAGSNRSITVSPYLTPLTGSGRE